MSTYSKNGPSLYEKIQNDLIEKIQNGYYKTGDRLPSEKELSDTYHVSRITSAKALTELSLQGYINRIQGKGSFANPLGSHMNIKHLPAGQTAVSGNMPQKIGLIIPEYSDYHSGNIIRGITETLQFPEFFVNIILNRSQSSEELALNYFFENEFSGVILFPADCEYYSDIILKMHLSKFSYVLIDRIFPGINCNYVTCDNDLGTKMGVEYLISIGHKNISYIADSTYKEQITSSRYDSYLKAMAQNSLPAISYENFFRAPSEKEQQESFLQNVKSGHITAVFASNSHVALRLYAFCMDNHIKVPEDLSIICFDNPMFSKAPQEDFFTYIEQNSYDMGKQAGLIIKDNILKNTNSECRQLTLKPGLVINRSTKNIKNRNILY